MLHWLSGQKTHDSADADTTAADIEGPETPAHTFAVRAFRHAIYGTPNTVQPKPRRRSNDTTRIARSRVARPKSTSDAPTIGSLDVAVGEESGPSSLPSPTKGILLTPGTATARRKNVSFGAHVVDNEGKRPLKSGLPDDCPGKFPSPWEKSFLDLDLDETTEKPRGRNQLNAAFEQVREESAKRKSKSSKQKRQKEDADLTADLSEPQSESGRYWKQEYDIYRERTTNEVRKLVEKNQLAKRYAREKDTECTEVREELHREQRKVEKLEKRMAELEAQLKELQGKSQNGPANRLELQDRSDWMRHDSATEGPENPRSTKTIVQTKAGEDDRRSTKRKHGEDENGTTNGIAGAAVVERLGDIAKSQYVANDVNNPVSEKPQRPERRVWKHIATQQVQERKPEFGEAMSKARETEPTNSIPAPQEAVAASTTRPRPRHNRTKSEDDRRVQPFAASNFDNPPAETNVQPDGQPAASGAEKTPLGSININTLTEQTHSIALSMGLQPPSPTRPRRQDSPMRHPVNLPLSPELSSKNPRRPQSPTKTTENDNITDAIPESSPFQPHAVSERPNILAGAPVPVRSTLRTNGRRLDTKENEMLSAKLQGQPTDEQQKPSAAWQAMNAPAMDTLSANRADSNTMPPDRLAAARARLASRGRLVS